MVSEKRNTPVVQQKPHPPIRFTAAQVARMAQIANALDADFAPRVWGYDQAHMAFGLEFLVADPEPRIPTMFLRALNLKQTRKGDFVWNPAA